MNTRVKEYLSYIKDTLSENSYKSYCASLRKFLMWAKNKKHFTEGDLLKYQLSLKDLKPNSQYKHIQVIKSLYIWLYDTGRINKNPTVRLKVKTPEAVPKAFRLYQLFTLVDALPETFTGTRDKALIALAFNACLRRVEITNIQLPDLNLINKEIFIRVSKNNKQRIAVFSNWSQAYLYEYLKAREVLLNGSDSPWLWLNRYGEKLSYNAIDRLSERVRKVDRSFYWFSLHKLRHSIASEIARNASNGNIGLIAEHLGHSQLETSYKYYVELNPEDLKNLIDKTI